MNLRENTIARDPATIIPYVANGLNLNLEQYFKFQIRFIMHTSQVLTIENTINDHIVLLKKFYKY